MARRPGAITTRFGFPSARFPRKMDGPFAACLCRLLSKWASFLHARCFPLAFLLGPECRGVGGPIGPSRTPWVDAHYMDVLGVDRVRRRASCCKPTTATFAAIIRGAFSGVAMSRRRWTC